MRIGDGCPVPVSATDVHDLHIVAVEMHGMSDWCGIVDYDADGGVTAEVFDVPFSLVGEVFGECEEEDRVVVVCAEGGAVHAPEGMASGIDFNVDIEVSGGCWSGGGCDGVIGNGFGEIIVCARARVGDVPSSATGGLGGVGFIIVDGC